MKRRGNVISPIDTINSLSEMLIQTDYTVEDGETVWVRSTQAMYVFRMNSGLVPDNINVIASLYGSGVWEKLNVSAAASLGPFNTVAAGAPGSGRLIDVDATQIGLLTSGTRVWVISVLDFWRWDPLSTLTSDNATVVNPTANGVNPGRFVREFEAAAEWKNQATWHINDAGSVDNDGLTAGTSIPGLELGRRFGTYEGIVQIQMTINVHSATTFLVFANIAGLGAMYFLGDRTVVASGTITAATAINRAAPGTRATITTSATAFAAHVGRRVRISGGNANARLDERFIVDADLGGTSAQITRPLIPGANRFTTIAPNGGAGTLPVNGDTFDIYTCFNINGGIFLQGCPWDGVNVSGTVGLIVEDLDVGQTGPNRRIILSSINTGTFHNLISVDFVRASLQGNNLAGGVGTSCNMSGQLRLYDVESDFYGGRIASTGALQILDNNAAAYPDMDIYVEGSITVISGALTVRAANLSLGTVGFFNAGNGLNIPAGATAQNTTNADTTHQLWGTVTGGGNVGINVQPGGTLFIDATTPTVTGPGGDLKIAGLTSSLTQVRATGAFTVLAGPITWATWAANLYLIDPNTGSRVSKST